MTFADNTKTSITQKKQVNVLQSFEILKPAIFCTFLTLISCKTPTKRHPTSLLFLSNVLHCNFVIIKQLIEVMPHFFYRL